MVRRVRPVRSVAQGVSRRALSWQLTLLRRQPASRRRSFRNSRSMCFLNPTRAGGPWWVERKIASRVNGCGAKPKGIPPLAHTPRRRLLPRPSPASVTLLSPLVPTGAARYCRGDARCRSSNSRPRLAAEQRLLISKWFDVRLAKDSVASVFIFRVHGSPPFVHFRPTRLGQSMGGYKSLHSK
jgi:hypothetical protein